MKIVKHMAIVASALVFSVACSNHSNEDENASEVTNDEAKDVNSDVMDGQKQTDAKHIVEIYGGSMCEVKMSEQAASHAVNAKTKEFAGMMIDDHSAMNTELAKLAAAEQITLQTDISDDAKKDIADMGELKGDKYDKEFLDKAVKKHKEAIDHAEALAKDGHSEQIKMFFTDALPKLQHHLTMAEAARDAVEKK